MTLDQESQIINFLKTAGKASSKEIFDGVSIGVSYATLKRALTKLKADGTLSTFGKRKGTKYAISEVYKLVLPIDLETYFKKEIDQRSIQETFNVEIITQVLKENTVFTAAELEKLESIHEVYKKNIAQLSAAAYKKELERLAIDLSWKSSQIEGNTYSLLETERLLKERETAAGKTKEEAIMLLNHKDALDFIIGNADYLQPLTIPKIEDIHYLLTKELEIERNVRKRRVGISGTNYRPLDNYFQISEALRSMCDLINHKESIFEKALLTLVLTSYIQPFMDGNKRTARIVSNAILMNANYCPLSFRTVDSIDYKKAMLVFYEQNNISAFKRIFITQFEFAVKTYF